MLKEGDEPEVETIPLIIFLSENVIYQTIIG